MSNDILIKAISNFKQKYTGGTVPIHGKEYVLGATKIALARQALGSELDIVTKVIQQDDKQVMMQADIYISGKHVATGTAQEFRAASRINQTSYVENCETSAIGRALASAGFAGSEFASADELVNALGQQKNLKTTGRKSDGAQNSRAVSTDGAQKSAGKLIGRWDSFEDTVGFGKHRNVRWIDVPQDYLIWIVDKATKVPDGAIEMAKGTLDLLESKVADPTTDPFPEDANSDPNDMVKKLTEKFDAKNTELEEALPF